MGSLSYGQADFTIEKIDISDAVITYATVQAEYDGDPKSVSVSSVMLGETPLEYENDYVF